MTRRWLAAGGVATLCLLAAACGGSSSPNSASSHHHGHSTTTTTATTTTAPTATTTTTTPGLALCTGANIGISGKSEGGAAGHQGVVLLFVNNGSTPCDLYGYPGVAGLNAGGMQEVQAQRTLTGMMGGLAPGSPPSRWSRWTRDRPPQRWSRAPM